VASRPVQRRRRARSTSQAASTIQGALLGTFVARQLRLPDLFIVSVDRHPFPILWSIIGAALFVALVHLISGGPVRRYWRYR